LWQATFNKIRIKKNKKQMKIKKEGKIATKIEIISEKKKEYREK